MIKGIDISSWQAGFPSFDGDFVIIRAGYGQTKDSKFISHYQSAIKAGKRVGVYWYSYALTESAARNEARYLLELIADLNITMGVWFDMEDADGYKQKNGFNFSKQNISAICNAFCEIIEKAGYYAGIYANYNYLTNYINCPKYDKWIAHWGANNGEISPSVEKVVRNMGASMWQYTSKLNGKSLDGDVLLHNDITLYDIKKSGLDALKNDLKTEIIGIIDKLFNAYNK